MTKKKENDKREDPETRLGLIQAKEKSRMTG